MISSWYEVDLHVFKECFLKNIQDLKYKNGVIELKCPMASKFGEYGGIFIGLSCNLDIKIFNSLSVDFPGLVELKRVKDIMLSEENKNTESVDRAYNSVVKDIILGRDFPIFMLTIYSSDHAAHLYPLNVGDKFDNQFLDSIFSYKTPNQSVSGTNRSVIYAKDNNKRYTGIKYLYHYFGDSAPKLQLMYRLWDIESFNKFANQLSNKDGDYHEKRAKQFIIESGKLFNSRINYVILDGE